MGGWLRGGTMAGAVVKNNWWWPGGAESDAAEVCTAHAGPAWPGQGRADRRCRAFGSCVVTVHILQPFFEQPLLLVCTPGMCQGDVLAAPASALCGWTGVIPSLSLTPSLSSLSCDQQGWLEQM